MADITKGYTHADGGQVTGATLNAMLDSATINAAFVSGKTAITSLDTTNDYFPVYQSSSSALKKVNLSSMTTTSGASKENITLSSHGFVAGDVLYYTGSTYAKAKADNLSTADVVGVVESSVDVNTFTLVYAGRISGLSGLTAGIVYYLSSSAAGAVTTVKPVAIHRPVYIATSTTSGVVLAGGVNDGVNPQTCNGRLTLSSGTAVVTADQTAKTSVFFTPYNGNKISLYNGTQWQSSSFSELTLSLGTALAANSNYDIFVYDNAGTPAIEIGAAWSSDTSRSTALVNTNGVWLKSGALTRRYVGTVRTTGTIGQTETSFGGSAAGGTEAKWYLWNAQNRTSVPLFVRDNTDSWTYSTNTIRSLNNSATNRASFVIGLNEEVTSAVASYAAYSDSTARTIVSVSLDSTTSISGISMPLQTANASAIIPTYNQYKGLTGVGYHYIQVVEKGQGSGTQTFEGDGGNPSFEQGGLIVEVKA